MAKPVGGLLGVWSSEDKLLEVAKKVKAEGFQKFDTITPFPVHGMDEAIGLKRSKIPIVTFFACIMGTLTGFGFQTYVFVYDWPMNIGGKPHFSLPAFVPIIFELTVLFGALITVGTMFAWNGLPNFTRVSPHARLSDDKFGLFIPENDHGYDVTKIDQLFQSLGAEEVVRVAEF